MSSNLSPNICFDQDLDNEARLFAACFVKTLGSQGTKIFTSR